MTWTFTAEIVEWRGPAPFYFLPMSVEDSADFKIDARGYEYWGQVRVEVTINGHTFATAVFPKDERYLVPLRAAVRRQAGIELDDVVTATVTIDRSRRYS